MNGIKQAIKQICSEKGLSEADVMETINSALAAAYRKDFGDKLQNIEADYNLETGELKVVDVKEVVEDLSPEELAEMERLQKEREELKERIASGEISAEELRKIKEEREAERAAERAKEDARLKALESGDALPEEEEEEKRHFNPKTDIQLTEAKTVKKSYKLGDIIKTELEVPGDFGRMAAQTAKQVIIQRLREAERNIIYQEYKEREGEILTGLVQKFDGYNIIIDLDKTSAILPPNEQIKTERFKIGDRVKVYLMGVSLSTRGPEIIVSRAHPEIVGNLFAVEIPEIANGVIEIKGIAREAGNRAKVAVHTDDETIDPIGSCIGQRGARIQTIINELGGEKIDIIEYTDDMAKYIANALAPAKITNVELNEEEKSATVTVPQDQLSLTIGRAGQNVRLATKLTGWTINIKELESGDTPSDEKTEGVKEETAETEDTKEKDEKPKKKATAVKKTKKQESKKTVAKEKDETEKEEKPKKKAATKKKTVKKEAKK